MNGGTEARNGSERAGDLLLGSYRVSPGTVKGQLGGLAAAAAELVPHGEDAPHLPDRLPGPLVALRARRDAPPPANLPAFAELFSTSLLMPLAHGAAGGEYWIVCDAPTGPCMAELCAGRPLPEAALIGTVLKPLAQALHRLHAVGLTHRGVRAGNLFRVGGGMRVVLGPGWTTPPAFEQDAVHEPVESAVCHPAARGTGTPADDVYALGVLLLELTLGCQPLAGLDPDAVVQRKLELGSFAALAGTEVLPAALVPVLRAMLSDAADARPTAANLAEHGTAAERPKAQRPAARSQRKLLLGRSEVNGARGLGYAASRHPAEAMAALRDGTVTRWLARSLDQPALAAQVEATVRSADERPVGPGDATALHRVLALLDPAAPLFWQERWFWPDGMPGLMAAQLAGTVPELPVPELMRSGTLRWWGLNGGRGGLAMLDAIEQHLTRIGRRAQPSLRGAALAYALNPFLPCASPLLSGEWVLDGRGLLEALERRRPNRENGRLLDGPMLALLAARAEPDPDAGDWSVPADAHEVLLDLLLLGGAQKRAFPDLAAAGAAAGANDRPDAPRPGAAPWLASEFLAPAAALIGNWPGRERRQRRRAALDAAARAGNLVAMLDACCGRTALAGELAALDEARTRVRTMRRERDRTDAAAPRDLRAARSIAGEASTLAGMLALLAAAAAVMVPS